MVHARTLLALAAFALPACQEDPYAGDKSGWTITDPGTGTASSGIVSPTWAGVRRVYADGAVTTMLGPTERWGKSLVRFQATDDVRFFHVNPEVGLLYDGTTRIGATNPPILLLPPALKDGMKWQILGTMGQALGTFTVEAKGAQPTLFGTLPVWRVTQKNEVTMNAFWTEYAEGRGAIAADDRQVVAAVIPLEPRAALELRSRTALTALGDGKPVAEDFSASTLSLIQPESGAGTLRVGGMIAWYMNTSGVGSYVRSPAVLCAQLSGGAITNVELNSYTSGTTGSEAPCGDASASVIHEGQVISQGVDGLGKLEASLGAPFVDADGMVRGIGAVTDSYYDKIWIRAQLDMMTWNTDFAVRSRTSGSLDLPWRQEGAVTHILGGAVQTSDAIGFVAHMGDRLFHARSDADGFSALRFVATVPGARLSARLDGTSRRHLFNGADGTVDELTITSDGATLTRVADLDLPEGHELVGALPDGANQLLVFTVQGRGDFVGGSREPEMGNLHAWTAALPAPPSNPAEYEGPSAAELNIVAMPTGPDVQVCWPSGTAELTGWTLGGHAARAIPARSDGSCVLLLRDQTLPFDPAALDAWLVEGPVPGVGRVAIAQHPDRALTVKTTPEAQGPLVALGGVGFTSKSLHYGPALTPVGAPPAAIAIASTPLGGQFPDLAGLGIWWAFKGFDCGTIPNCTQIKRWGAEYLEMNVPSSTMGAQLAGGGVILQGSANAFGMGQDSGLLLGDGTLKPLDNVPGGVTYYYGGKSDGTACGISLVALGNSMYRSDLFCRDPDGTLRVTQLDSTIPDITSVNTAWWAGPGGFYAPSAATQSLWYIDPTALTATAIALPVAVTNNFGFEPAWSASGELFLLIAGGESILQVKDGVVTSIAVPAEWRPPGTISLVVGPDLLILTTTGEGPHSILRLARP
jgi:hypothetical protein